MCGTPTPSRESLMPTSLPRYPWQMVGDDLFQLDGVNYMYLLVVDCFSRYPEITKLTSTTSPSLITALIAVFSRPGIPQTLRSNNGPQFDSNECLLWFLLWHKYSPIPTKQRLGETSSPNSKTLFEEIQWSLPCNLALLVYQSTPLSWHKFSPAEV